MTPRQFPSTQAKLPFPAAKALLSRGAAALVLWSMSTACADPLIALGLTKTGKRYEYYTPDSGTPVYKGSTAVDTSIIIRDLADTESTGWRDVTIRLNVVGSKKYYAVDLRQEGKWSTVETGGSTNAERGVIRYPGTSGHTISYTLDGGTEGAPNSGYYMRFTDYLFGVRASVPVPGAASQFFAPTVSGYGSLFESQSTPSRAYPNSGRVIVARNYVSILKYSSKNTSLVNAGSSITVNSELLLPGRRSFGAYQLVNTLKKSGYLPLP